MTPFSELKNNLKDLIEDNLKVCIDELKKLLGNESRLDELRLISSNYKSYRQKENMGTADFDFLQIQRQQVANSLINLINDLAETDFRKGAFEPQGIEAHILVVSYDKTAEQEMRRFFSAYFFKNVEYSISGQVIKPKDCDVILFDNRIMGKDIYAENDEKQLPELAQNHLTLLRNYLKETTFNIIYFGDNLHLVTKNRNRINAANSRFTLYSRIQETLDAMKYYGK